MVNLLSILINWIKNFWGKIPKGSQEKIINVIVQAFDDVFREFYRSKTQK